MNKLLQYINSKEFNSAANIVFWITIPLWVVLILYGQDIKAWRIKSFQEQQHKQKEKEPPLITCRQCKGTGEYPTDINKLMMEASLALYINHHLMVDKCKRCAKLTDGSYAYCNKVNDRYTVLLKEYAAAGPKIDLAVCSKCMGMGRFTCKKADGSYKTQEEYNKEYELESQSHKTNP